MPFLMQIKDAFFELSQKLATQEFFLDENNRCHFRYKDLFDVVILVVDELKLIQLHAYIYDLPHTQFKNELSVFLLESNLSDKNLKSAQYSIDKVSETIVLTSVVSPVDVNGSELIKILNKFITAALHAQELILSFLDNKKNFELGSVFQKSGKLLFDPTKWV